MWSSEQEAREQIKSLVADYYYQFKEQETDHSNFKPGDRISYASRVYDEKEMQSLSSLDDLLESFAPTEGRQ